MLKVRAATPGDIDWLVTQLESFGRFFGSKIPLFDEAHARGVVLPSLIEGHVVLIAEDDDHGPVGLIGGMVSGHPFNPKIRTLTELFWWVPEEHRGSRAGLLLLNAFTEWGKANVDWISMSLEHHSPVADRTLTRRGYRCFERSFLLEVA